MSSDGNMERFAHDVFVHVLEKFGIFKAPDDTRKRIECVRHNFLARISRSVVSFAIWIRADFKNALEDRCKITDLSDNDIMWIFDEYLVLNDKFSGKHWTEKVCISLALCTEYIQFASTKGFTVSLNKLVSGWIDFFEKHLRTYLEEKGGFPRLHNCLKISQIGQLGNFQEAFISEYCLPYGAIECTEELAKEFIEKRGLNISLEETIFGIKKLDYSLHGSSIEKMKYFKSWNYSNIDLFVELVRRKSSKYVDSQEPKCACSGTSDSEEDSSSSSAKSDVEKSQNAGTDASDSEISPNNLLGIPPHEDTLREIDPFFVENIPSPPKAQSSSKSLECESVSSDAPRSSPQSLECDSASSDASRSSSQSSECESPTSDASRSSPHSPECKSASNDARRSSPQSLECESASSDELRSSPETKELKETVDRILFKLEKDMDECESASNDAPRSSPQSPECESASNDAPRSSPQSPECESASSDAHLRSSPETKELEEKVEKILSKLESDMDELRSLLFEHGLLLMKSGRRGSRMRVKDSKDRMPPKGPEGLI